MCTTVKIRPLMTKKVSLKYKIPCLSVTSTIHTRTSPLEYMYIQVELYFLFRLQSGRSKFHHWKWTTNFKGFILHVFSLDKLQWNEKSLFSRPIQMFILATVITNEQLHKSSTCKCKLKMLCYKTNSVNLIFGHCCCFSHPIHLVSTIIEMQQHLRKVTRVKYLHGIPWKSMEYPWSSMDMPWSSMEYQWSSMECHRVPWSTHGVPWSSMK